MTSTLFNTGVAGALSVEVLVEIGPGKVLNGLTKRIVAELQATSVNDVASLDAVEALLA